MTREHFVKRLGKLFFLLMASLLAVASTLTCHAAENQVSATPDKPFVIELSVATGSTGYSWTAQFDENFLSLKKSYYKKPESKLLGAPGKQIFEFVPIKPGHTVIEMRLKRPWEPVEAKNEIYNILISRE